jgi:hypothetical protein
LKRKFSLSPVPADPEEPGLFSDEMKAEYGLKKDDWVAIQYGNKKIEKKIRAGSETRAGWKPHLILLNISDIYALKLPTSVLSASATMPSNEMVGIWKLSIPRSYAVFLATATFILAMIAAGATAVKETLPKDSPLALTLVGVQLTLTTATAIVSLLSAWVLKR